MKWQRISVKILPVFTYNPYNSLTTMDIIIKSDKQVNYNNNNNKNWKTILHPLI